MCLVHKLTKERATVTYAKYVMSVKHGRRLSREEEVDHVDGNKLNDDVSNLEIVSRKENKRRYDLAHPEKVVSLECDYCHRTFSRVRRQTSHSKPGQVGNYCSRSCNGLANLPH